MTSIRGCCLLDPREGFEPVHFRHLDVENDDVGLRRPTGGEFFEGLVAAVCRVHANIPFGETFRERLDERDLVIDE